MVTIYIEFGNMVTIYIEFGNVVTMVTMVTIAMESFYVFSFVTLHGIINIYINV